MTFDIKNSYWSNCGAEQATYDRLYEALVPDSGDCATVEGELLRAISKVYYDHYNNGLGNDMRGPVAFLMANFPAPKHADFMKSLAEAAPENRSGDGLNKEQFEALVTDVIQFVASKNGRYTPQEDEGMWSRRYRDMIETPCDLDDEDRWA